MLQMVELLTVPLAECRDQYEKGVITENMICAAASNKDSCFVSHSAIFILSAEFKNETFAVSGDYTFNLPYY